jgi:hypothetical protein
VASRRASRHTEPSKRGGRLEIAGGGIYELKPASHFKERYALSAEGRELATIEASGWSAERPAGAPRRLEADCRCSNQ